MSLYEDYIDDIVAGAYEIDEPGPPYIWKTKSGKEIPIEEMTASHIRRCMKLVGDKSSWYDIFEIELTRREIFLKSLGLGGTLL